ncbi:hypothetical protein HK57_00005 [Aspergillus ustus]|uniref:Cytochrome P450 n=1 Tax=Aspergillus ustus TaxID=40382 RepID=A0A0C1BVC7_ASPUT|nr:hypothetical protein HK57_00005 [Aspergillus ustus]
MISFGLLFAALGLLGWALARRFTFPGLREAGLPSGPEALPLIGSIHKIPRSGIHLQFTKWAQTYGPILSLKIGHGTMVVLTSAKYASQLLEKRSAHYSNRPPSYIVGGLVFHDDHPMFMDADDRWKLRRKLYHQLLREPRCNAEHVALVQAEAAQLVKDIALEPEALMLHPGRFSNSIIMSLVFGIRTPRYDTPHYLALQTIMTELSALGEIGATPPVDLLPILKYIPEKLYGNWRSRAAHLRQKLLDLHGPLVDQVISRREKIGKSHSFLDGVLDGQPELQLTRNEIDIMCGNLLEGGTDTMATTLLTLCQAMGMHPDIQREAHRHLDEVIGEERMPLWEDYDKLPFVAMIVKELLRWRPPAPGAFPHAVAKDDEIEGQKIPKNSTIVVNIWGIHHDPTRYPNPDTFDPYRFTNQTQPAPVYANAGDYKKRDHFGYGSGRRICPGIHLAERALFIATAQFIWAFDFKPKTTASGRAIPIDVSPDTAYRDGFLNQCRPFEMDISVRSEKRKEIILAMAEKAERETFSQYL